MKSRTRVTLNGVQEGALKNLVGNLNEQYINYCREYTDEYLNIFRILIDIKIELDQQIRDETSKTIKDFQSPTTSKMQKAFQKKSTKILAAGGVTTDLKDVKDNQELKRSIIYKKKIKLEEKNQKHYIYLKSILKKKNLKHEDHLILMNSVLSQKYGNLTHQLDQEQNNLNVFERIKLSKNGYIKKFSKKKLDLNKMYQNLIKNTES